MLSKPYLFILGCRSQNDQNITNLLCWRAYFQFKVGKVLKIGLDISLNRQILSERDIALMVPIYN